ELGRERRGQPERGADEQGDGRQDGLRAVGAHEREEPAQAGEGAPPRELGALGRERADGTHADAHETASAGASSSSETNVRSTRPWRQISAYTGLVSTRSSWRPRAATRPSSST